LDQIALERIAIATPDPSTMVMVPGRAPAGAMVDVAKAMQVAGNNPHPWA
jgi:hypothetical protein